MVTVLAYYRRRLIRRYLQSRFRPRSSPWRRQLARGIRTGPFTGRLRRRLVFERHVLVSASGRALYDTSTKFGARATIRELGPAGGCTLAGNGHLVLTVRTGALSVIPAMLVADGRRVAIFSAHSELPGRTVLPRVRTGQQGFLAQLAFPSWQALFSARRGLAAGWDVVLPVDSSGVPGDGSFRADYPRLPGDTSRLLALFRGSATSIIFMCTETRNVWRPEFTIIRHDYSDDQPQFIRDIENTLQRLPHQWHVWTALGADASRLA